MQTIEAEVIQYRDGNVFNTFNHVSDLWSDSCPYFIGLCSGHNDRFVGTAIKVDGKEPSDDYKLPYSYTFEHFTDHVMVKHLYDGQESAYIYIYALECRFPVITPIPHKLGEIIGGAIDDLGAVWLLKTHDGKYLKLDRRSDKAYTREEYESYKRGTNAETIEYKEN